MRRRTHAILYAKKSKEEDASVSRRVEFLRKDAYDVRTSRKKQLAGVIITCFIYSSSTLII